MKRFPAILLCLASIPLVAQDASKRTLVEVNGSLEKDGDIMRATGGVKITGFGWVLQADSATFNTTTHEIQAHGNVTLQQGESEVKAQDLTFHPEQPNNN